jgi:hypothetical protein
VFSGQHRIFPAVKYAVAVFLRAVFKADKLRLRPLKLFQFFGKGGFGHLIAAILASSRGNEKLEMRPTLPA